MERLSLTLGCETWTNILVTWTHFCYSQITCKTTQVPSLLLFVVFFPPQMLLPYKWCVHLPVSFFKKLVLMKDGDPICQTQETSTFWQERWDWDCSRWGPHRALAAYFYSIGKELFQHNLLLVQFSRVQHTSVLLYYNYAAVMAVIIAITLKSNLATHMNMFTRFMLYNFQMWLLKVVENMRIAISV